MEAVLKRLDALEADNLQLKQQNDELQEEVRQLKKQKTSQDVLSHCQDTHSTKIERLEKMLALLYTQTKSDILIKIDDLGKKVEALAKPAVQMETIECIHGVCKSLKSSMDDAATEMKALQNKVAGLEKSRDRTDEYTKGFLQTFERLEQLETHRDRVVQQFDRLESHARYMIARLDKLQTFRTLEDKRIKRLAISTSDSCKKDGDERVEKGNASDAAVDKLALEQTVAKEVANQVETQLTAGVAREIKAQLDLRLQPFVARETKLQLEGTLKSLTEKARKTLQRQMEESKIKIRIEALEQMMAVALEQKTTPTLERKTKEMDQEICGLRLLFEDLKHKLKKMATAGTTATTGKVEERPLKKRKCEIDDCAEDARSKFKMIARHPSLRSLYSEWYGYGDYQDSHGGIAGRDKQFGDQWRSQFQRGLKQQYSDSKRIVAVIDAQVEAGNTSWECVCDGLEADFAIANNRRARMVDLLHNKGLLKKKKGAKRKAIESPINE